ncbi:MAG: hypothetical protein A2001_01620 [Treponema sp. GWC1_61_84]|nr:MAG: hypothetical protein A2001_01620 [Treponema sp. GWC1_61_84]
MPNADQAVVIARTLGMTVEELVDGKYNSSNIFMEVAEPASQYGEISGRLRKLFKDLSTLPDQDITEIEALVSVKLARRESQTKHA